MANLTGKLSQVGSAILLSEAAQKHQAMVQAYGKDIPIITGYMSEWDWFTEASACWNHADVTLTDDLNIRIRPLLNKIDPTNGDRQTIASFFENVGGWTQDSSIPITGAVNNWNWTKLTKMSPNLTWSAYGRWRTTGFHPVFPANTFIYGFPNKLSLDPRRSGNFVLFNVTGNDPLLRWLFQNSYKYNFYFYGPLEGAFMYIKTDRKLSARTIKALSMGYNANAFLKAAAYLGRDPEDEVEIEEAIQQILLTVDSRKERDKYLWNKIGLVLEKSN